jgi:hypothetical protein
MVNCGLYAMKILFKSAVVVAALFLELIVLQLGSALFFGLGHGQILDTHYRQKERVAAFIENIQHPSLEAKAKLQEELSLMRKHEDWKTYLGISLFFAINGIWIYYYFRERRWPNLFSSEI